MQLIGMKYLADMDIAEKYAALFTRIYKVDHEEGTPILFHREWCEQVWVLTLFDGKYYHNYMCWIDRDDGYRSRAYMSTFCSLTGKLIETYNKPIEVSVLENHTIKEKDTIIRLRLTDKKSGNVIFICKTEDMSDYYPCGVISG